MLKQKFNTSKLGSAKKDPDEWIAGLELIRRKLKNMGHPISDMDMMIHVINNLPKEYDAITDQLENEIDNKTLDMGDVRQRLRSKYNKMKIRYSKDTDDDNSKEKSLTATQSR
jgi:hypothetical protein